LNATTRNGLLYVLQESLFFVGLTVGGSKSAEMVEHEIYSHVEFGHEARCWIHGTNKEGDLGSRKTASVEGVRPRPESASAASGEELGSDPFALERTKMIAL
jgi:hypothetical protein